MERDPKIVPVAGETFLVPGEGPIGNPLVVGISKVENDTVHIHTAMGDATIPLAEWPDYVNYPDVTVRSAEDGRVNHVV